MILKKLVDWITNPLIVLCLFVFFSIIYIVYLEISHELTGKFWEFGPALNDDGEYYKYMTFTLDNWPKVITVYVIIFLTAFITTLYKGNFSKNLVDLTMNTNKYLKWSSYAILGINPLIYMISYIVNFFAVACFQVQYLLPLFIGSYMGELPYIAKTLMSIGEKKIL